MLKPQIDGGKSTTVYRSGTPVVGLIASTSKAIELAYKNIDKNYKYVESLNKKLLSSLSKYKDVVINSTQYSIPYIINISIKGIRSSKFVELLEENEVYVSAKTSCCPVSSPSKLVYALTKDKNLASTSVRISLSCSTKEEELVDFINIFDKCYKEVNNGKI